MHHNRCASLQKTKRQNSRIECHCVSSYNVIFNNYKSGASWRYKIVFCIHSAQQSRVCYEELWLGQYTLQTPSPESLSSHRTSQPPPATTARYCSSGDILTTDTPPSCGPASIQSPGPQHTLTLLASSCMYLQSLWKQ